MANLWLDGSGSHLTTRDDGQKGESRDSPPFEPPVAQGSADDRLILQAKSSPGIAEARQIKAALV